ncbi:hypothetical protein TCAL_13506 [Tigriopus californicus]|uniref:Uncharacterized protein n=1 Tax=Tigriopus californicus TaxID=6832 RepID=A0A553PF78_TIGCA|nr:hypothetical protein TCAL_13506 [Tigriopus californicus]
MPWIKASQIEGSPPVPMFISRSAHENLNKGLFVPCFVCVNKANRTSVSALFVLAPILFCCEGRFPTRGTGSETHERPREALMYASDSADRLAFARIKKTPIIEQVHTSSAILHQTFNPSSNYGKSSEVYFRRKSQNSTRYEVEDGQKTSFVLKNPKEPASPAADMEVASIIPMITIPGPAA